MTICNIQDEITELSAELAEFDLLTQKGTHFIVMWNIKSLIHKVIAESNKCKEIASAKLKHAQNNMADYTDEERLMIKDVTLMMNRVIFYL